jgi:hypothetical protein
MLGIKLMPKIIMSLVFLRGSEDTLNGFFSGITYILRWSLSYSNVWVRHTLVGYGYFGLVTNMHACMSEADLEGAQ